MPCPLFGTWETTEKGMCVHVPFPWAGAEAAEWPAPPPSCSACPLPVPPVPPPPHLHLPYIYIYVLLCYEEETYVMDIYIKAKILYLYRRRHTKRGEEDKHMLWRGTWFCYRENNICMYEREYIWRLYNGDSHKARYICPTFIHINIRVVTSGHAII